MLASVKMAQRVELVESLTTIDVKLKSLFVGAQPSTRTLAEARSLLKIRARIGKEMQTVGYQPWNVPVSVDESEAM